MQNDFVIPTVAIPPPFALRRSSKSVCRAGRFIAARCHFGVAFRWDSRGGKGLDVLDDGTYAMLNLNLRSPQQIRRISYERKIVDLEWNDVVFLVQK